MTSVHEPYDPRIWLKECKSLRNAGYDVVLVAAGASGMVVDGIQTRGVRPPANRLVRFLTTTVAVARAAWREKPALVHMHDPELLPFAQLFRILGVRVVFDMHENTPKSLRTKEWIPASLRIVASSLYRAVERVLLSGIPVIFAESSYEADYSWTRNGVTILNFPLVEQLTRMRAVKFNQPTVGYMGRVSEHRGSVITARALAKLGRDGVHVRWDCVGIASPACEAMIQEQVGKLTVLHGPLPPLDGWRVMAQCHIGLAVLSSVPNYRESYPTKLFEYMALGLPVVASNFPLYREVVESAQCGLCVDPESVDDVADAIRWLVEHPAEAREMGSRGRAAVSAGYSWESEEKKLLGLYGSLLEAAK